MLCVYCASTIDGQKMNDMSAAQKRSQNILITHTGCNIGSKIFYKLDMGKAKKKKNIAIVSAIVGSLCDTGVCSSVHFSC